VAEKAQAEVMSLPPDQVHFLLNDLLRQVSRSFYLTLRMLPGPIRPQISLAYLLARATDTVADSTLIPLDQRLETLSQLKMAITQDKAPPELDPFVAASSSSEGKLLGVFNKALALLKATSSEDQARIRQVLNIICSGQELDLTRFRDATIENPIALQRPEDLYDYTWRVAGCVGEFWTQMCLAHLKPAPALAPEELVTLGIAFGKGLQLVNILRDIPADLAKGRCYLPELELLSFGLRPRDLKSPANFPRLQPLYRKWLTQAEAYLEHGWSYTCALPLAWFRVRLACAWPILIGQETLRKLAQGNPLDPTLRIKTSRAEVRSILIRTTVLYPFQRNWKRLGRRK
jgi:farnesyl-diphosphate farnesyltransferase